MSIELLNVIQHYKGLPHQLKAVQYLQHELSTKYDELLEEFAKRFRTPEPAAEFSNSTAFQRSLQFVLDHEGLLSDDKDDSGGRTYKGITQKNYDGWRKDKKLPQQDVAKASEREVIDFYYERYWQPAQCALLSYPLDLTVMDTAVNFGVNNAFSFISEALGGKLIYSWPPIRESTLKADPKSLSRRIVECRLAYRNYRVRTVPSQRKFYAGWVNRDNDLLRVVNAA